MSTGGVSLAEGIRRNDGFRSGDGCLEPGMHHPPLREAIVEIPIPDVTDFGGYEEGTPGVGMPCVRIHGNDTIEVCYSHGFAESRIACVIKKTAESSLISRYVGG